MSQTYVQALAKRIFAAVFGFAQTMPMSTMKASDTSTTAKQFSVINERASKKCKNTGWHRNLHQGAVFVWQHSTSEYSVRSLLPPDWCQTAWTEVTGGY